MIIVKFEEHRLDGGGVRELGRLTLANTASDRKIANYDVMVQVNQVGFDQVRFGMFRIKNYELKKGFLRLIKEAMDRVVEELGYAAEPR